MLLQQIAENSRINGTGASGHHKSFHWSETHGGCDGFATENGAGGTATAEMADDEAMDGQPEQFVRAQHAVPMADAMEAIAADAMFQEPFVRNRVDEGPFG